MIYSDTYIYIYNMYIYIYVYIYNIVICVDTYFGQAIETPPMMG